MVLLEKSLGLKILIYQMKQKQNFCCNISTTNSIIFILKRNPSLQKKPLLNSFRIRNYDTTTISKQQPYVYYKVLGIPRTARIVDIKHAYIRLAKQCHPDVVHAKSCEGTMEEEHCNKLEEMTKQFNDITEAYTTLIDVTQRHFYDQHGFSCEELKSQAMPSIFEYRPKYSIYEEDIIADGETTEVEDWFKAQGHSMDEPRISFRQRMKNFYVEWRFGLKYYNFPWNFADFGRALVYCGIAFSVTIFLLLLMITNRVESLPADSPLRPRRTNDMWENDDTRDILAFYGIRKMVPSSQSKTGAYTNDFPREPRKPSEYTSNILSNTRRTLKSHNKERHKLRQKEMLEKKQKILERKRQMIQDQREEMLKQIHSINKELEEVDQRK